MKKTITLHDETEIKKLERLSYLGGELAINYCGSVGDRPDPVAGVLFNKSYNLRPPLPGPCYELDSNSLFPSVMHEHQYPCKLVEWACEPNGRRSLVHHVGRDCIAECLLDGRSRAIYSRRRHISGRWSGCQVAVLVGPELEAALTAGTVLAVKSFARYDLQDLFSSFVDYWWQKRWMEKLAGRQLYSDLCKNLLNSLYGKFGQKTPVWKDRPDLTAVRRWASWFEINIDTGAITQFRSVGDTVQQTCESVDHPQSFTAICSFVTAHARSHMLRLRAIAGDRHWFYQGIDSLYVDEIGLKNLKDCGEIDQTGLGKLRIEGSSSYAHFASHGLFQVGEKLVRTATARGARPSGEGLVEQDQSELLSSALARVPDQTSVIHTIQRRLSDYQPAGVVGLDGWVRPLDAIWGDHPSETLDSWRDWNDLLRYAPHETIAVDLAR